MTERTCFAKGCKAEATGTTKTGRLACDRHLTGGKRFEPSPRLAEIRDKHLPDPFPPATLVAGGVMMDGVFLRIHTTA